MAHWEFPISIDRAARIPVFMQISRAIAEDITRGRLRCGDPLPGTRTLARALGVQRQTVVAAYDELVAETWIVSQRTRGMFVSAALPEIKAVRAAPSHPLARIARGPQFAIPPGPRADDVYDVPHGVLFLAPCRPDVRLVPADMIGRAYRRAIRSAGGALLSYALPHGHPRLRSAIASMVAARRGVAASMENVCVTRGSQMALALTARTLLRPGDVVAVEDPGYRPAWEVFRAAGALVVPVPVDWEGVSVSAIERLHDQQPLRAVFLTPHHQFPTTVTLSTNRRMQLLRFATQMNIAVIEDDYDHEFHYDGRPIMPLMAIDVNGVVIYIGSLSKVLAPALRIGYIVAPSDFINRAAAHRSFLDGQGDQVLEAAIAELFDDGEIQRHVRRVAREYNVRRDALVDALHCQLGETVEFCTPAGGIGIWVRVVDGTDVEMWAMRARERRVMAITASAYTLDGRQRPFFRLGFAALTPQELCEAVRRLADARLQARTCA